MNKSLLSAVAAASLFALPALAQSLPGQLSNDAEIRVQQEWQQLVAKVNHAPAVTKAQGDVAAVTGITATDASPATRPISSQAYVGPQPAVGAAGNHYRTIQNYGQDR